jgi:hypothetical protein
MDVARLLGLIPGTVTGMATGMMLTCGVFLSIGHFGLAKFPKEPLLLIPAVGCVAGGFIGCYLAIRYNARKANWEPNQDEGEGKPPQDRSD